MVSKKGKFIWSIPRLLKMSWKLFKSTKIPAGRKLIILLLGLGYLIWPMDLIPDIPFIGQIDDLGILFLLLNWFVNQSQEGEYIEADYYIDDDSTKDNK